MMGQDWVDEERALEVIHVKADHVHIVDVIQHSCDTPVVAHVQSGGDSCTEWG